MPKQTFNRNEMLLLTEAEKFVPYSANYLSLRIRQGKLRAQRIGRNWYTKKEWIAE